MHNGIGDAGKDSYINIWSKYLLNSVVPVNFQEDRFSATKIFQGPDRYILYCGTSHTYIQYMRF